MDLKKVESELSKYFPRELENIIEGYTEDFVYTLTRDYFRELFPENIFRSFNLEQIARDATPNFERKIEDIRNHYLVQHKDEPSLHEVYPNEINLVNAHSMRVVGNVYSLYPFFRVIFDVFGSVPDYWPSDRLLALNGKYASRLTKFALG